MMTQPTIEIINYKEINKGSLVGIVDVFLPKTGMYIYGCTYCVKGPQKWVSLPTKEYTDKEGKRQFLPINRFKEKTHQEAFSREVIAALSNYQVPKDRQVKSFGNMQDEEHIPF